MAKKQTSNGVKRGRRRSSATRIIKEIRKAQEAANKRLGQLRKDRAAIDNEIATLESLLGGSVTTTLAKKPATSKAGKVEIAKVTDATKAKALQVVKDQGGIEVSTRAISKALGAKATAVLAVLAKDGKLKVKGKGAGAHWSIL